MKLLSNGKIVVGFDLCDNYSQISYANAGENTVETLSLVAGEQNYNIPTLLCKKIGVNQWLYGKDALKFMQEEETKEQGILVENLVSLAINGEPIQIDGESYQPESLLALFFKRCLGMLSQIAPPEKIGNLMITCEKVNGRMLEVIEQVVASVRLKADKVFIQSHVESFYHFMLYQPEELWRTQTLLCEYGENEMKISRLECNRRTTPIVVYVKEASFPFPTGILPENEELRKEKMTHLDETFLHLLETECQNQTVASVYLIGEQFAGDWMQESLKYLCKGRRVFQGNNLYSKGACFGMLERLLPGEAGKTHVFLGEDKLRTNIGMKVLRQGQDSYFALLDAGVNWFESENTVEFYLQEGNVVELLLTSLIGGGSRSVPITLEGLPEGSSRLKMHLHFKDEKHLLIEIEDLGFGVFRPATKECWKQEVELE